ncbi:MAG: histidine phosphatase family protein [Acidimicrobiia bacterium]
MAKEAVRETTILLVRHGELGARVPGDPGLSMRGRELAKLTADFVRGRKPTHIFSSPLRRSLETAEIMGHELGLAVESDERLRERANWGDVEGQSLRDFIEQWERSSHDRDFRPLGGISAREAGERLGDFVFEVAENFPSETTVAVSHGGVIVDFLLNMKSLEELEKANPEYRDMTYCSITGIRVVANNVTLTCLADAGHLKPDLR